MYEICRWNFEPHSCRLHQFESKEMEQLIGPKSFVFMVGDSITSDQGEALQCILDPVVAKRVIPLRSDFLGMGQYPGGRDAVIAAAGLDPDKDRKLVKHLKRHWRKLFGNAGRSVKAPSGTENDILIFNSGAHWTIEPKDAKKLFRGIAMAIKATFKGLVLFRTNVMGHAQCEQFSKPFHNVSEELVYQSKYNWRDFGAYNAAISEAFEAVGLEKFKVFDVSMFEKRGDGHVQYGDCLHYCKPGIPDFWNKRILHHILKDFRMNSTKGVEREWWKIDPASRVDSDGRLIQQEPSPLANTSASTLDAPPNTDDEETLPVPPLSPGEEGQDKGHSDVGSESEEDVGGEEEDHFDFDDASTDTGGAELESMNVLGVAVSLSGSVLVWAVALVYVLYTSYQDVMRTYFPQTAVAYSKVQQQEVELRIIPGATSSSDSSSVTVSAEEEDVPAFTIDDE